LEPRARFQDSFENDPRGASRRRRVTGEVAGRGVPPGFFVSVHSKEF
jgi:hypothetical protein